MVIMETEKCLTANQRSGCAFELPEKLGMKILKTIQWFQHLPKIGDTVEGYSFVLRNHNFL